MSAPHLTDHRDPGASGTQPELMTAAETIAYLRLDVDERDATERLRNLIRRQRLPVLRRGRLQLFRRAEIDAWLAGEASGRRTKPLARLVGK
jgi:hypothetical protein